MLKPLPFPNADRLVPFAGTQLVMAYLGFYAILAYTVELRRQ